MSNGRRKRPSVRLEPKKEEESSNEEDTIFNGNLDDEMCPPSLVLIPSITMTLQSMVDKDGNSSRDSDSVKEVPFCQPAGSSNNSRIGNITFDGTTVLCQVCGDKASGFHYGVHACEGCKGFFRRSIQQKIQYRPCSKNQQCSILRINRNRCQYCRLKKCIAVGMSRDAVRFGRVPKREKAKILAEMQRASAKSQNDTLAAELEDEDRLVATVVSAHLHTCEFTREKLLPLLARYRQLGLPRAPSQVACPLNPNPLHQENGGEDLSERYSPAIRGVVDFAKSISGFHILSQEDQVTLLKAGMFEILLLRLAVLFDSDNKCLMLLDGTVYRRDVCPLSGGSSGQGRFLVDSLFDFVERFNTMALNDADIALYCAIVLISPDRPGLRNRELVEKMQDRFKDALRKVLHLHHPGEPSLYNQLMMKIPDLRTLNTLHQEKLLTFRVDAVVEKDTINCKSSESSSTRSRSPQSDRVGKLTRAVQEVNGRGSHWSLTCKASDSSPSVSPTQNQSGSPGSAEAAHFHSLHISASNALKQELSARHWPAREASSFDSGKGTLSAKASSCSGSESDEGSPRVVSHSEDMPTLKRALQAPPVATMASPAERGSSLREKHRAVASLLEQPASTVPEEPSRPTNIWPVLPQHAAAFWLSSRAAALSGNSALLGSQVPVILEQSKILSPNKGESYTPTVYQPATAAISPAHSGRIKLSPKRALPEDSDEQPLNLSKKRTLTTNHL